MKLDQCGRPEVTCVNVTAVLVMYPGRRIIIKTVTGGLSNKTVLSGQPFHATPPRSNKNTVPSLDYACAAVHVRQRCEDG